MTEKIEKVDNGHDVYHCNGCGITFSGDGPTPGFKFLVGSETSARFDDDNDFFIAGTTKVLVGKPCYGCHNDEFPCFLDEGDWTIPQCEMYVCTCGAEYTFDNDYCSDHSYSTEQDAKQAAERCLASHTKNTPTGGDGLKFGDVKIGDRIRVSETGADGCGWYEGDIVEVTEIHGNARWMRGTCVVSANNNTQGTQWNITYGKVTMHEALIDDELADKFKPKTAEKKVRYIDL